MWYGTITGDINSNGTLLGNSFGSGSGGRCTHMQKEKWRLPYSDPHLASSYGEVALNVFPKNLYCSEGVLRKSNGVKKATIQGKKIIWANNYTNPVTFGVNSFGDTTMRIFTSGQYFDGILGGGIIHWKPKTNEEPLYEDWIRLGKSCVLVYFRIFIK